jgi:N-methylhydantoinase B/oxoprolinase/acetone carboxylase alpha subunit
LLFVAAVDCTTGSSVTFSSSQQTVTMDRLPLIELADLLSVGNSAPSGGGVVLSAETSEGGGGGGDDVEGMDVVDLSMMPSPSLLLLVVLT